MEWQKTGNIPDEVLEGVLVPLPKPGKPQGPPANLRPVILLSILRKILAISMIKRIQEEIENRIPLSQAAYRAGRSTTEQVFTCKILEQKAITSECYETPILLLDMSKAFDTVKRNSLMEMLETILDPDENTPKRCKTTRRLPEPNFIHIIPSRCPQKRKIKNHRRTQL